MASGQGAHDLGDENHPVSIHISNPMSLAAQQQQQAQQQHHDPSSGGGGLVSIQVSKLPSAQHEGVTSIHVTKAPLGGGAPQIPQQQHEPVALHVTKTPMPHEPVSIHVPGSHEPVSIHVTGQHEQGPSSSDSHQSGQTEQRLKVEDALNYLDQVKYKFGNQPQVYNDFLDIMKEFKSQSIDTPGVISRVSNLFRGHPELIVGFNTFLPPGYKIEVQTHDTNTQISYRVDGVTSYVVANMLSNPLPAVTTSIHAPIQQQTTTSQIIQHTATPGVSIRPILTHTTHPGTPAPNYDRTVALWGVGNGSVSPPLPAVTLTPSNASFASSQAAVVSVTQNSNTNFENVEPSSAFTHSFTSPFVQNAFPSLQSQPVQFNHAINYVNKIKNRFCGQPDKYKQFLDILHTYQKEQRNLKEGIPGKQLSEHEVYSQVSKIFENQEDLLQEFGQFLPESNHAAAIMDVKPMLMIEPAKKPVKLPPPAREYTTLPPIPPPVRPAPATTGQKRTAAAPVHAITTKKPKLTLAPYKDISIAEAARYGTLQEYAFFDKLRVLLKHQIVYDNFIRCLYLFNKMVFSRQELLTMVQPFFCKSPEMFAWLKEFVTRREAEAGGITHEPISHGHLKQERVPEEQGIEIGEEYFSTCKRLGASYCALPKNHVPPMATGRTPLDKEVLNDLWVSFPTWSEDSTFVTSRKTQFEEYICRCEDERFELDVVIESNADTIKTLEAVARRMARMTHDDLSKFTLDECLGGRSTVLHQRSIKRVYGDKAGDFIEGLKQNPFVCVPIVLRRLKIKEEEWRDSQREFNKIWRDQVERFYLKSLDHQGITFKQSDIRMLRSKALVNEIETIYDERHDQETADSYHHSPTGPHLILAYTDRVILDDACNLLLHHVRRQSGIQNEEKRKIKQLLKHFIPDLFMHTRMELSDDEQEGASNSDPHEERKSPVDQHQNGSGGGRNGNKRGGNNKKSNAKGKKDDDEEKADSSSSTAPQTTSESRRTAFKRVMQQKKVDNGRNRKRSGSAGKEPRGCGPISKRHTEAHGNKKGKRKQDEVPVRIIHVPHEDQDETYCMIYVNNAWYVFLRLHQILCERLGRMYDTTAKMMAEEAKMKSDNAKTPPAVALRMRPTNDLPIADYYPAFLEMVKNLLDGNMEPGGYEDTMRELYGINAYITYTMDKLVTNAVRQLQTLVTDEVCLKFTDLYFQAHKKGGTGGVCDTAEERAPAEITYQKQAEKIDPEENCYKIVFYHKAFRVTMELLEGANIEENIAETTKWSAYIDSYTSHPNTGMDAKMKSLVKPVFLSRNVAVGQKCLANKNYPPELARIFGTELEDMKPMLSPSSSTGEKEKPLPSTKRGPTSKAEAKFMLNQTLAPVTPEEAEELEKQLEKNSKRRSELVKDQETAAKPTTASEPKAQAAAVIPPKNYLVTNDPVTPEEAERLEKQLEANAKRRAEAVRAPKSLYIISDNLQCKFQPNSYKMVYVVNTENLFYLRGSLKRAKEAHKKVSTQMNDAFGRWHQAWLEAKVTEEQIMRCDDFLMSTKNSDTKIVSSNDISLPPYHPVNRYVVKK